MAKKKTYPQNKRTQLQQQLKEAAARKRRNRLIGIIVGAVVVVVAIILIVVFVQPSPSTTKDGSSSSPSGSTPPPISTDGMFIPPDGTSQMGWIQVPSANTKPNAIIVDEHIDYQCPICHEFDGWYGAAFRQLASQGDIILRIHVRSFLDGPNALNNDSSIRAATAAACADTVGDFIAYHETIFANQPSKEGTGYTDQQLRVDFPAQAGITGNDLTTFQSCYDSQKTLAYAQAMEQVNSTSTTINDGVNQAPPSGTPAYYVNGKPLMSTDLYNNVPQGADASTLLSYLQTIATSS